MFGTSARSAALAQDVPGDCKGRPDQRQGASDINAIKNQHRGQDSKGGEPGQGGRMGLRRSGTGRRGTWRRGAPFV